LSRLDAKNSPNDSTTAYAMLARMRNKGTVANLVSAGGTGGSSMGQTGVMFGIRHTF